MLSSSLSLVLLDSEYKISYDFKNLVLSDLSLTSHP